MRILLWHGYLLGGTGSNVYTRMLAREWSNAGHDVTVLSQEPHPERFDLGSATSVRPDVGGLLPIFVLDRYEGYDVRRVQDCSRAELDRWVEANAAAIRALLPADVVFTNHVLLGGPVGAATGAPFAVKAHGSELEYSMRGNPELSAWGAEALAAARATFVGSDHIRTVLREVCGHTDDVLEVPPGVDIDEWVPEPRDAALAGAARGGPPRPAEPRQRRGAPARRGQRRSARALPRAERARRRLLRQADRAEGRPRPARGARGARRPPRRRRLRPRARRARGARRRPWRRGAVHRPARAPPPPAPARARGRVRGAVDLPRGVRHGRGRGRRRRLPAARRPALRASPRSRPGSRRRIRPSSATWRRSTRATPQDLARRLRRAARAAADRPRRRPGRRPHRGRRALELGGRLAPAARAVRLRSQRPSRYRKCSIDYAFTLHGRRAARSDRPAPPRRP